MRLPEHLESALSRIREKLGRETEAERARKSLYQELETIDSFIPLHKLLVDTIYEDYDLLIRLFDADDPVDRIKELIVRCVVVIEKGEELDEKGVRAVAKQVISQEEPPPEVKELLRKLEKSPHVLGKSF